MYGILPDISTRGRGKKKWTAWKEPWYQEMDGMDGMDGMDRTRSFWVHAVHQASSPGTGSPELQSGQKLIVIGVGANPEPNHGPTIPDTNDPIPHTDAG